jgi:predicted transposase/invertase (TIGR01784 family)
LDKWVAFLTSYHVLENSDGPLAMDEDVKKALDVLETMTLSDQELDFYENHLKWLRDQEGALETRFLEGREEGKLEGREEGEAIGIEKGKLEIAKAMLAKGMDVETVADLTGLPIDILQNLTQ